ncbi:hypothetical protein LSAT2_023346 [Lamellibrachia satsuma]|nr:hypothetical protein LSAT2_023346 [Lamellibrachia satsuma]
MGGLQIPSIAFQLSDISRNSPLRPNFRCLIWWKWAATFLPIISKQMPYATVSNRPTTQHCLDPVSLET